MKAGCRFFPALAVTLVFAGLVPTARAQERKGFSIRITEPAADSFRIGKSVIVAEVEGHPDSVEKVEFFADGILIFIDEEAPYHCIFDFGDKPKSWVLEAVAHHRQGITVSDTVITRLVAIHYRVDVDRVLLSAIVTHKGHLYEPLPDFTRDDFTLLEDGTPQEILEFSLERRPLTLAIVIDTSGSMLGAMKTVHRAASACVESLRAEDRGAVVDFDENVYLLQDFTSEKEDLKTSIQSTFASGGTALFDAINASLRLLADVPGPKAIILLSDGEDTDSRLTLDVVVERAKTSDIIIYTVGLGTGFLDIGLRGILKDLAESTGGKAAFPDNVEQLEAVYKRIAHELTNNRYQINYSSSNPNWNGDWREISLAINSKGFKVRTREGYYAVR
ncbi:MAG: VWA domain-containing protein [Acidobacteriota bacterium]